MLMKTVFKKGMKVYDQVFFGKAPLKIIEVKADMSLRVLYGEVIYCYTGDGRFIGDDITSNRWRPLSQTPTLSTSPYTLEGFEQKASAPTFEEVLVNCDKKYPPNIRADVDYKEIYPTKELSEAAEALRRLLFLRDYYNDGWQPDWEDGEEKFSIQVCEGEFHTFESIECQRVFSFKTEEIRDKFLEEQRELLEIAKPLL